MKSLMILFFFMAFMAYSSGQSGCSAISFTYDNAGNRVKRQYVVCGAFQGDEAESSIIKGNKALQNAQMSKVELDVYPNPNKGVFQVSIEKPQENTVLDLYDFTGRKLKSQIVNSETNQVNVNNLATGSYLIVYRNGEKILGQRKVIIE